MTRLAKVIIIDFVNPPSNVSMKIKRAWITILLMLDPIVRGMFSVVRGAVACWEELILRSLDPSDWDTQNRRIYNSLGLYRSSFNQQGLEIWEQTTFSQYLPKSPAHLLICAAGGGRESIALAKEGYLISVVEPVAELAKLAEAALPNESRGGVMVGTYRDLIETKDLSSSLGREKFDAVILGAGSLSHISSAEERVKLFEKLRVLCPDGPLIMSWVRHHTFSGLRTKFRGLLDRIGFRAPTEDCNYGTFTGFLQMLDQRDIENLALASKSSIAKFHLRPDKPHAVFIPA